MNKNTGDGELDEILGRFELVITQGLLEVIKQNLPKTALDTTLGEHRSNAKTAIKKKIAQEANKARLGLLTELLDELKELEQLYNGPAGELARVGGKDSGLKYLRALTADFEDRIAQLTKEKESSDERTTQNG